MNSHVAVSIKKIDAETIACNNCFKKQNHKAFKIINKYQHTHLNDL